MIFDDSCRGGKTPVGLTHSWIAGGMLFAGIGKLDGYYGARSWREAFEWILKFRPKERIDEIQYWGHGRWGEILIDTERFDISYLRDDHPLTDQIDLIRDRLTKNACIWIRTCETFGANAGHQFAEALANRFQCKVAGHTFIIGPWQSGLHVLSPGEKASWSPWEGILEGTPKRPIRARWSKITSLHTVSFLNISIPKRLK